MAQKFTSANTSINSTRLPKVYGMLEKLIKKHRIYGGAMLDYGCGKYTEHLQREAKRFGFSDWRGHDKFNLPEEENKKAEYWMKPGLYDLAVCSNVLNVIDDEDAVQEVVRPRKTATSAIRKSRSTGTSSSTVRWAGTRS